MNTIKENFKFIDLYGAEVIFEELKLAFKNVSFRLKSIPADGSISYKTSQLKPDKSVKIEKLIQHKNGEITIKTSAGYLRFF